MIEQSQIKFDFPSFAFSLMNFPTDRMLHKVEEQIKGIYNDTSDISLRDERKLRRLESFLRMGRFPSDMTPEERKLYGILMDSERKMESSAAGTPTQHLATQRNEREEARSRRLEEQLALCQQHLREQTEAAEMLIQQLVADRDEKQIQLSEADARAQKLQETLKQEKKAAEALVHQLKAEQDERRTQLSGFESHLQNLEEQLALAQKQFQDQRETVTRVIQQRAADREESQ